MHTAIEFLNVAGDSFGRFAAAMLLQSSILILLLLGLDLLLRRRVRAVLRYWMWMLVLVKLVLPPGLGLPTGVAWWLGGPIDTTLSRLSATPVQQRAANVVPAPSTPAEHAYSAQGYYQMPRQPESSPRYFGPVEPVLPSRSVAEPPPPQIVPPAAEAAAPLPLPALHPPAILLLMYAGVLTVLVSLLVHRVRSVRRLIAQAREPDAQLLAVLDDCRRRMAVRRPVGLKVSPGLVSPAVCGLLRPTILMPDYAPARLDERHLRPALLHELAHIRRGDMWTNLAQTLLLMVYFYNPMLWVASAIIRRAREQAVDEAVLVAMGEQAAQYPETLVAVAQLALTRPALSLPLLGVVESRSALSSRVRHILGRPMPKTARLGTAGVLSVVLLAAALLPMAARSRQASASPAASPSTQPTTQPTAQPTTQPVDTADSPEESSVAAASPAATQPVPEGPQMRIRVVAAEDAKPIANASVNVSAYVGSRERKASYKADEQGECTAVLPSSSLQALRIRCRAEGRVPMAVRWDAVTPASLLKEFTFPMEVGTTIGGVIRNEDGEPIAGASVHLLVPRQGAPSEPNADIYDVVFRTDEQGRWRCDYAPAKLNDVWIRLEHPDYAGDNMFGMTPKPPIEKIRDQTGEMVMKRGLVVTGVVVDPEGKPVERAAVKQGRDRYGSHFPETKTDEEGTFTFRNCAAGTMVLTTVANGLAPDVREIAVAAKMEPLRIELKPGRKLTVRVVDGEGKPIRRAWVIADTWRGYRALEWKTYTNANGVFVWNSAPPDAVLFDILKQGYMDIRRRSISPSDEEQTVTMVMPLQVSGKVVDAATSQPVPQFQVISGVDWRNGSAIYWERDGAKAFRNGTYEVTFDFPRPSHLLRVEAPGYVPAVSRAFTPDEGRQSFDFKLEKGQELTGTVLDAEGKPVGKATVLLATPALAVMIENGRDQQIHDGVRIDTDPAGRFHLPPQTDPCSLVVLHEKGYGQVSQKDFEASREVRLTPWSRVDGVLKIGARPGAGQRVAMNYQDEYDPKAPRISRRYQTTTDADGRFVFERAVAGEAWISREIKLSDNMTTYTHSTPIDITPEEATHVTIGGTGRPVVGKVRLPESAPKKINWAYVQAHVSTKTPKLEPPADVKDKGQEALQAWYAEWSKSDEAKAQRKARRSFSFKINDDGTFRIEDVPAGTYQLNVTLNEPPPPNQCGFGEPIGSAAKEFTVEAMETGRSDEPQDLGALDVEMYKHLNVGDAAPAFEVPTLDDRTLKLADLRGKYVLLDFWATWCGPCRGETPHLKSVYEKFGKDPRFVIVSLSLDPEQKEPREYAKKEGMDWPQGFLGDWSKTKLPNEYGVRGIPAIFLIGPDGKILAKDLRGPAILSAVEKALSSVGPGAATSQPPAAMRLVD